MEGSNFAFLQGYHPLFLQLAVAAERSFVPDPNTTLIKLVNADRKVTPLGERSPAQK